MKRISTFPQQIIDRFPELDKKWFKAIYKTNVLKYKGMPLQECDWGNIVSETEMFEANDVEDAKKKAENFFNLNNRSFRPLDRTQMEVKHHLVEIKEIVIPDFKKKSFKNVNALGKSVVGKNLKVPDSPNKELSLYWEDESKFTEEELEQRQHRSYDHRRRKMKHFVADEQSIVYQYGIEEIDKPYGWNGYPIKWYEYTHSHPFWKRLDELFKQKTYGLCDELELFENTEYTDLIKEEQNLYKKYLQLMYLDDCRQSNDKFMHQGHYFVMKYGDGKEDVPIFKRNEYGFVDFNWTYKSKHEKEICLKKKMKDMSSQMNLLQMELESL